jgi:hypothetical protein
MDWNSIEKLIDYDAVSIEEAASSSMPVDEPLPPFNGMATLSSTQ